MIIRRKIKCMWINLESYEGASLYTKTSLLLSLNVPKCQFCVETFSSSYIQNTLWPVSYAAFFLAKRHIKEHFAAQSNFYFDLFFIYMGIYKNRELLD